MRWTLPCGLFWKPHADPFIGGAEIRRIPRAAYMYVSIISVIRCEDIISQINEKHTLSLRINWSGLLFGIFLRSQGIRVNIFPVSSRT